MKTQEPPASRVHLTGVFTALVTPFTEKGDLDEPALRKLVRRQIGGGVAGVVPCGTTGEAVTLDLDEHERAFSVTVEEARSARRAIRVIAGCGSNDTRKSQKLAERCRKAGADALLALSMIPCGADGVISVVSNETPSLLVALVEAPLTGERDEAVRLQAKLLPLMRANFRESSPIPVKWALHRLGLIQDVLRLPLVPLSKGQHKPTEEALREAGLLDEAGNEVEEES